MRARRTIAGLLVALAAIAAALGYTTASPSPSPSPTASRSPTATPAPTASPSRPASRRSTTSTLSTAAPPNPIVPRGHRGGLGEADGAVPDGTTVFSDAVPGVANLDAGLLDALRQAATDAASDGIQFLVDSGWRSPEYQERLLQEAVAKYGSEAEAARWVATPATSAHVSGEAVDIGRAATTWLSKHGAAYGLCQIYRNEPWHYELRPDARDRGCPAMYADATHDPRMQG